jgi:pimeloyl-ACP methyl ester carboxylesterase
MNPFTIDVPQAHVDDLKRRLAATRYPDEVEDAGWDYGTSIPFLRKLVEHWRTGFDWRKEEARLNGFRHFTTELNGERVHFIHASGAGGNATPILLANGWPSNFVELLPLVPLLTREVDGRSFDVVIPSIPGFGFSGKPRRRGMNLTRTAHLWAGLMTELGYDLFLFSGTDMGAGVGLSLVRNYPDRLLGAHFVNVYSQYPRPDDPTTEEQSYFRRVDAVTFAEAAYAMQQSTKPTTLAVGLNDSPAGLASWIIEKFHSWGDTHGDVERVFPLDTLCSILSVYWFTETIASSMRLYKEASGDHEFMAPMPRHNVPQGVLVPADSDLPAPRAWGERHLLNLVRWNEAKKGGHFPALEVPQLLAEDIRGFAQDIRR